MQSKPALHLYEYSIIRLVPDIERGEAINVGLAMMCKRRRWLRVDIDLPHDIAARLRPLCNLDDVAAQLAALKATAEGSADTPLATLETHERFRWLTAVRSTCITTSRPHPGKTADLDATFDTLFDRLIRH